MTIFINLTGVPLNASVTAPEWDASSSDCEVTYRDALSRIEVAGRARRQV